MSEAVDWNRGLRTLPPGQWHYLMVDGSRWQGVERRLYDIEETPVYANLFFGTDFASVADVGPLLIAVDQNSRILGDFVQSKAIEESGYLVSSDTALDTLAEQFRHFILARHPLGYDLMLRFADPAVVHALLGADGAASLSSFWGSIKAVAIPDSLKGQWIHLDAPDHQGAVEKDKVKTVELTDPLIDQMEHVDRRRLVVEQVQHIDAFFPNRSQQTPRLQLVESLEYLCSQALSNGYTSKRALTHWANVYGYIGMPNTTDIPLHSIYRHLFERQDDPETAAYQAAVTAQEQVKDSDMEQSGSAV
ncbi:DUF4123 domain-containing protein [Marinobacter sp. JSM 1782161]|uniref:DUF4123 domain-containing protein n=1 Tax=Marinobacter sp. JSM 1782161 TaxID=2685906 RepID=UPI001403E01E|nr:DUF4123 domain-containing protein [Marinobacter sp. JSM 1782161]